MCCVCLVCAVGLVGLLSTFALFWVVCGFDFVSLVLFTDRVTWLFNVCDRYDFVIRDVGGFDVSCVGCLYVLWLGWVTCVFGLRC